MFASQKFTVLKVTSVLVTALVSQSAFAVFPNTSAYCDNSFATTMKQLFVPASIIGSDDRVTIDEKAKIESEKVAQLQKNYPTRQFFCGNNGSEASIVGSSNVILIAAHAIYDENCNLKANAQDCFVNDHDGEQYEVDISTLKSGPEVRKASNGGACSLPRSGAAGTVEPDAKTLDWAVMKLKRKVKQVKAYGIEVTTDGEKGNSYTVTAAMAKNFKADPMATTFQAIAWNDIEYTDDGQFYMKVEGDLGSWMSGAPAIDESRNIKGILVRSTSEDCPKYNKDTCFSSFAPVTQEMYNAVKSLAK